MWHNQSLMLYNLGRYAEALQCNDRALALMQFGVARDFRQKILDALARQGRHLGIVSSGVTSQRRCDRVY